MSGKDKPTASTRPEAATSGDNSEAHSLYDNASMKHPLFNKMDYGPGSPGSKPLAGPKLNELTIDVPNVHVDNLKRKYVGETGSDGKPIADVKPTVTIENYQKIAREGTEFIGANGSINLQVKHALSEAFQSDQSMKTGHQHVDKLMAYMNENLYGTNFSVVRDGNKFLLLDSRDNPHPKHDASGNAILNVREGWDIQANKYYEPPKKK